MSKPSKQKVMIVDDHPIIRESLAAMVADEPEFEVCCLAATPAEALDQMTSGCPDMAIVDLVLERGSGLDLIKDLRREHPQVRILVVSMNDEMVYAERALRAGANGYIMKHENTAELLAAVRAVSRGEIYVNAGARDAILKKLADIDGTKPALDTLTDRELQVLEAIAAGTDKHGIARTLGLSVKTIESYRDSLRHKLGLRNVTALAQYAVKWKHGDV